MADNTQVANGTGDVVRDKDRAGVKTQVVGLDLGIGTGTESLMAGFMPTKKAASATGTITSVTAVTTSTTILAANTNRLGALLYNDSTAILYLGLTSSAVTVSAYSVQVGPGRYYELPNDGCGYVGQLTGLWSAANGAARVTELT